jgi:hypothetical protein
VRRPVLLAAAAVLSVMPAATASTAGPVSAAALVPTAAWPAVAPLLSPVQRLPDLPEESAAPSRLATAVRAMARSLGVPLHGDAEAAVQTLPAPAAALLAEVVERAQVCRDLTAQALPRGVPEVRDGRLVPLEGLHVQRIRACAGELDAAVRLAAGDLPRLLGTGPDIDLWPVLRVARGNRDDVHRHDYAVLVDEAGDDTHLNAAGSNMLDLQRAPGRTPAARGCEQVFPDTTTGGVRRGPEGQRQLAPPDQWGPECTAAVGVLLDLAGDDVYGERTAPGFPDDQCTAERVVRRIATQGVGFAGVGILHDAGGADRYTGKTLTQGAGHLGGVGLLRDEGSGDDRYLALRSAQGVGLLAGLGLLHDEGGDDDYDFYLPRPRNPRAPAQAEGSGGVNDDTGLGSEAGLGQHRDEQGRLDGQPGGSCDGIARSVQGVGLLAGVGLLLDAGGDDRYRAAPRAEQEFLRPLDGPAAVRFVHGSQGSGLFGGVGALWDGGGRDRYLEGRRPSSTRGDGVVLVPSWQSAEEPTHGGAVEARAFVDRAS